MRRALVATLAAALAAVALSTTSPAAAQAAGRLPLAEPGVEGSVARLYLAFLDRPADDGGLDRWVAQYRDGASLQLLADMLALSPEHTAAYGGLDDPGFLDRAYRNLFGRPADAGALDHWTAQLAGGRSRSSVLLALAESPEHVAATATPAPTPPRRLLAAPAVEHRVARVYLGLLQRWPDADGFDHWVRRSIAGAPLVALTDAILGAPELRARYDHVPDGELVRLLYRDVLGREPDDAGVTWWVAALANGASRGGVVTAFTESPEFVARTRTEAPPAARAGDRRLLAVGDSVMLGARDNIRAIAGWTVSVDTRGCRQPTRRGDGCGAVDIPSGVDALRLARAEGRMGGVVVIQLGNNGPMSAAQFDEVMAEVLDVPRVIWLNLHEPRSYEGPNNRVIAEGVARYPNTELIDWHGLGQGKPWFGTDGIHLTHTGRQAMADLIAARIAE